jgi:hypothetical protein
VSFRVRLRGFEILEIRVSSIPFPNLPNSVLYDSVFCRPSSAAAAFAAAANASGAPAPRFFIADAR